MRLIDADALIKALIRKEPFSDCARVVIAECIEEVRHAKTVEPERKKGAWINEGRIIRCNKCKIGYATVKGMKSALTYNFCPDCGATMREDNNGGYD